MNDRWKRWLLSILFTVIALCIISILVPLFTEYGFGETLFVTGMILLMVGIFNALRGQGNRGAGASTDNDLQSRNAIIDMERELQEIRSQGARNYVTENRNVRFTTDSIVMSAAGLMAVGISYLTLLF